LGRTLLQQTYDRFLTICPKENILVVTNAHYASIVNEQLPDLAASQILSEPHAATRHRASLMPTK
jgi:mannose-1-phosphate guanylyltransferase